MPPLDVLYFWRAVCKRRLLTAGTCAYVRCVIEEKEVSYGAQLKRCIRFESSASLSGRGQKKKNTVIPCSPGKNYHEEHGRQGALRVDSTIRAGTSPLHRSEYRNTTRCSPLCAVYSRMSNGSAPCHRLPPAAESPPLSPHFYGLLVRLPAARHRDLCQRSSSSSISPLLSYTHTQLIPSLPELFTETATLLVSCSACSSVPCHYVLTLW